MFSKYCHKLVKISILITLRVSFHPSVLSPIKLTEWKKCCLLTTVFLMFVAILNAILELVFFSSCHISLALSVHFACPRSFSLAVLTQSSCCYKITTVCELVLSGNKMVPAKYNTSLLLQQITSLCFVCFKKYASPFEHGLQKTLLKLGFCSGSSSSCDAKVKANQMARKEGKEGKSLVCAES